MQWDVCLQQSYILVIRAAAVSQLNGFNVGYWCIGFDLLSLSIMYWFKLSGQLKSETERKNRYLNCDSTAKAETCLMNTWQM